MFYIDKVADDFFFIQNSIFQRKGFSYIRKYYFNDKLYLLLL